ncbi:hypothetical protein BG53_15820 [Paenibacillus darwinianus]|uniref:Uncharacterized protein n=1 Tax=Paenibacillus darwinianus TaxID=1380763 RepID=A0A9W5S2P0_9BACL|nr:hypothetical protein BG53_15820 [Paenibacillus darwinianus]EXX90189.1 hypothetical protein BG52_13810 [Paenibacillus darwinianus]EXX91541.1 hypothetical protein CH50_13470 [Paenibacillus darwinianus]
MVSSLLSIAFLQTVSTSDEAMQRVNQISFDLFDQYYDFFNHFIIDKVIRFAYDEYRAIEGGV